MVSPISLRRSHLPLLHLHLPSAFMHLHRLVHPHPLRPLHRQPVNLSYRSIWQGQLVNRCLKALLMKKEVIPANKWLSDLSYPRKLLFEIYSSNLLIRKPNPEISCDPIPKQRRRLTGEPQQTSGISANQCPCQPARTVSLQNTPQLTTNKYTYG